MSKQLSAEAEYIRVIQEYSKRSAKRHRAAVRKYLKASDAWRKALDAKDWKKVAKARQRIRFAAAKIVQLDWDMRHLMPDGRPMRLQVRRFGE